MRINHVQWRNRHNQYGLISQLLHWVIVALVIYQVVLGVQAADLPFSLERLQLLARHKSLGMTVLMLTLLRFWWRLRNPIPAPPANMARWLNIVARCTHWSFYALLVLIPLSGWILSSASNLSVSWFGLFTWPDLVGADQAFAERAETVHQSLVAVLTLLVTIHVCAALVHQFVWRDNLLMIMLPRSLPFRTRESER